MKSWLHGVWLASLACVSLCSCTVEHSEPVWIRAPLKQEAVPADSEAKLKVDDVVRVQVEGQVIEYKVVELQATGFVGATADDRPYPVAYSNLAKMWVRRWRTQVERAGGPQ